MRKMLLLIIMACLVLSVHSVANADVVLFDNFNLEHSGIANSSTLNYNNFNNWSVTSGSVDLIGNGYFDFFPGNGLYVDLDGSTGVGGTLTSSSIPLTPGTYELRFDLGGNMRIDAPDTVTAAVSFGAWNEVFTRYRNDPLNTVIRTFVLTSPINGSLIFTNLGGDNQGAILDNVQLAQMEAIPEPATMSLLGLGLLGLITCFKRNQKI